MAMHRFLTTTVFVLFTGLVAVSPAVADTGPAEFVRTLGNAALGVIRADMPPAQKQAFFHQLLQQDFDVSGIARFVLGPSWRIASEPEKQEFSRLFMDYIVRVYSERFAQYRGETLRVTGSRSDPEGATVTSEIVGPQGAPSIKIDWRLSTRDGFYKISDVIIDGVSMRTSERSEFASVIQRNGGQMQALLAMLRENAAPTSPPPTALSPGVGSTLPPAEGSIAHQRLVADAVRLIRFGTQASPAVGLVIGVIALEPDNLAVTLEGEDVGGNSVEKPAVMGDDDHTDKSSAISRGSLSIPSKRRLEVLGVRGAPAPFT